MKIFHKVLLLAFFSPIYSFAQTANNQLTEPAAASFFVGAGINISTFSYQGAGGLNSAKAYNCTSPQINAGTDIYFDRSSQTFVFRVELGYTWDKAQLTANYSDNINAAVNQTYNEKLGFNQTIGSLTPQVIWNVYNGHKLKIFVDAGVGLDYCNYTNKQHTITTYYLSGATEDTAPAAFPQMHSVVFNLPLKVGVKLAHRVDIYAGYIPKTALNSAIGEAYNYSAYQFGVNYFFRTN